MTGREPGVWEEEGNGRTIEGCSVRLRVGVGGCVGWIEWRMGWGQRNVVMSEEEGPTSGVVRKGTARRLRSWL